MSRDEGYFDRFLQVLASPWSRIVSPDMCNAAARAFAHCLPGNPIGVEAAFPLHALRVSDVVYSPNGKKCAVRAVRRDDEVLFIFEQDGDDQSWSSVRR